MEESWQPLGDFLGAEVPRGKPFPRLNDRQAFPKMMRRHMVAALAPRAVRAIATVSVLLAAAWALRSAVRSPRRRAGRAEGRRRAPDRWVRYTGIVGSLRKKGCE